MEKVVIITAYVKGKTKKHVFHAKCREIFITDCVLSLYKGKRVKFSRRIGYIKRPDISQIFDN